MKEFAIAMIVAFGLFSCNVPPRIIKPYGFSPYPHGEGKHAGVDFDAAPGTPVIGATDGIVTRVFLGHEIAQNAITILPGYGLDNFYPFQVVYGHLEEIFVREGDRVKRGQLLGLITWKEKVPHLHFGIVKLDRSFASGLYYSDTYDPSKFWLDGKIQCFDPKRDYSNVDVKWLTAPIPCWEYKKVLMKELREQRKGK